MHCDPYFRPGVASTHLTGLPVYTKGKLVKEANQESYYFLVSSKRALEQEK